jgi:hypothetical protein
MAVPKRQMQKRTAPLVMKKDEAEQPRIAWHKLGITTTLELADDIDDSGEIQILAKALENGIATTEMVQDLIRLRKEQKQVQEEKIQRQRELYAKYVEWLPENWFVEGAPAQPDFSDPETYKLLRAKRFGELYRILAFGSEQAEVAGGN